MLGIFEVKLQCEGAGVQRTLRIKAENKEEALNRVRALGEQVESAHLIEILDEPTVQSHHFKRSNAVPDERYFRSDAQTALALSWLGVIFAPLAIVGMIWGLRLQAQTHNRYGEGAFIVGLVLTILWGCMVLMVLASAAN